MITTNQYEWNQQYEWNGNIFLAVIVALFVIHGDMVMCFFYISCLSHLEVMREAPPTRALL